MRLKTVLAATALLLSSAAGVVASGVDNSARVPKFGVAVTSDQFVPIPKADVQVGTPVLLAQNADSQQLEEQIRLLSGKVEELNFQVLQMQEQVRKMQEDNEFRFQELEKSKQGSVKQKSGDTDVATDAAPGDPVGSAIANDQNADADKNGKGPKDLGTVTFDANGNPVAGSVEQGAANGADTASLGDANDPKELYKTAYDHVLAGEYPEAEKTFRQHIEQYPTDPQTADARYWLGESLASQDRHREAAEVLLAAQKDFPKAKKAPDMLLKLGVSLAALDNKDVACATFAQVVKKYPKASAALLDRVSAEQRNAGC